MSKQSRLYISEGRAYAAAQKRGEVGLTGSGQTCGPVELLPGRWAYKTWDNRYLIPGGELTWEQVARRYGYPYPYPID